MNAQAASAVQSDDLIQQEINRHFTWNFVVNTLDGLFFWGGGSFITASTILPLYIHHLTDSRLLIGLIATISSSGWMLPQVFTAHYAQRLPQKKKMVVRTGFFTERLPLFFLPVSVYFFSTNRPKLALWLFFLFYTWHTIGAGAVGPAWQDMIGKIFPVHWRGRFFGTSNFVGSAVGIVTASGAAYFLHHFTYPLNFTYCFAAAAIGIFFSWLAVSLTREPVVPVEAAPLSYKAYGQELLRILREDHNFRRFISQQILSRLGYMSNGFIAVYALERWHVSESTAALYAPAMLIAQMSANVLFGWLADKWGHKIVLEMATLSALAAIVAVWAGPTPVWVFFAFAGLGISTAGYVLSGLMIVLEFSKPDERSAYIGLANSLRSLGSATAPLIGGIIAQQFGYTALFGSTLPFIVVAFILLHWYIQEPRTHGIAAMAGR